MYQHAVAAYTQYPLSVGAERNKLNFEAEFSYCRTLTLDTVGRPAVLAAEYAQSHPHARAPAPHSSLRRTVEPGLTPHLLVSKKM